MLWQGLGQAYMMNPDLRGTVGSHFCKPIEQCVSRLHRGESHYRDEVPWRRKHMGMGESWGNKPRWIAMTSSNMASKRYSLWSAFFLGGCWKLIHNRKTKNVANAATSFGPVNWKLELPPDPRPPNFTAFVKYSSRITQFLGQMHLKNSWNTWNHTLSGLGCFHRCEDGWIKLYLTIFVVVFVVFYSLYQKWESKAIRSLNWSDSINMDLHSNLW